MKLASVLVEIEHLEKEVHLSQSKVASMTKRVETLNVHQKLVAEALGKANKKMLGS